MVFHLGKVEMITGVGKAMHPSLSQWNNPNRPIAASGVFAHYMVTPSAEALFVVNGESRTVNCEIGGLVHPRAVVWVTMHLQWTLTNNACVYNNRVPVCDVTTVTRHQFSCNSHFYSASLYVWKLAWNASFVIYKKKL